MIQLLQSQDTAVPRPTGKQGQDTSDQRPRYEQRQIYEKGQDKKKEINMTKRPIQRPWHNPTSPQSITESKERRH